MGGGEGWRRSASSLWSVCEEMAKRGRMLRDLHFLLCEVWKLAVEPLVPCGKAEQKPHVSGAGRPC